MSRELHLDSNFTLEQTCKVQQKTTTRDESVDNFFDSLQILLNQQDDVRAREPFANLSEFTKRAAAATANTLGWVNFLKFLEDYIRCLQFFIPIPKIALETD